MCHCMIVTYLLGIYECSICLQIDVEGLVCVGKRFHEYHFCDASPIEVRSKYVEEVRILCSLRHPNVIQVLGICFSHDHPLPMLVTEKLEGNLHSLLETVPNIPLILKRSLLEDIARGLHYLHTYSPTIIHGDLTATNVLYTSSLVAKITDTSNAHLVRHHFHSQSGNQAQRPPMLDRTLEYMPPETGDQRSPKFDIFSFGHLALWIMNQV